MTGLRVHGNGDRLLPVETACVRTRCGFHNPDAGAVGTNLELLLVASSALSSVMSSRWKGEAQQEKRDREIERQANSWGRTALTGLIIGISVTIGLSPLETLQWATHSMIANLLVPALMCGFLSEHSAGAVHDWRDRH